MYDTELDKRREQVFVSIFRAVKSLTQREKDKEEAKEALKEALLLLDHVDF